MVGHGGSSAGSYLADPTSPIPSHCASIAATSIFRVNNTVSEHMNGSILCCLILSSIQAMLLALCLKVLLTLRVLVTTIDALGHF